MIGTLFDTVGVVELSYGKFGEFVAKLMGKEERICSILISTVSNNIPFFHKLRKIIFCTRKL